uniref:Small ArfGAP 1 n=1 Tax=Tetraodon nigroviridis TaxID=99883 RepID=H3CWY9_TETNG
MTTRSEREKAQKLNEQHQAILSKLLREDDNKYCADCQAKGPRWASWNLGVFMCIRCAGIHRNLGVHISRVKSVNLDQWTPEQIQSMVDMGNNRARLLYEAHLPDTFQRPQTDQAVEVFIRDKYERKRYYNEALAAAHKERDKKKEEKKKDKESDKVERQNTKVKGQPQSETDKCEASNYPTSPMKSAEPAVDLLSLEMPHQNAPESGGNTSGGAAPIREELDIFGPMVSNPLPSSNNTQQTQSGSSTAPPQTEPCTSSSSTCTSATSTATKTEQKKLLSKDSILSLYASSPVGNQNQQLPAAGQGEPSMQMDGARCRKPPLMENLIPALTLACGVLRPSRTFVFPGLGGAVPAMTGDIVPNGGYAGMPPQQPQAPVAAHQGQWSMNQMNQQMSGLAVSDGAVPTFPPSGPPVSGWAPPTPASSGQTLSTQLWK